MHYLVGAAAWCAWVGGSEIQEMRDVDTGLPGEEDSVGP